MKEGIIFVSVIVLIVSFVVFTDISNSALGKFFEQFTKQNWDQVKERNIVKNSFPITLLEKSDKGCTIDARNFKHIINHVYFVRSVELAKELHYDKVNKTILVPCDMIPNEESKFHVWYATKEALKHPTKYEYFITPIEDKN